MNDPRGGKRRYLASVERNKMLARYKDECVDKPTRQETEEEKRQRLLRYKAKELADERLKLHFTPS